MTPEQVAKELIERSVKLRDNVRESERKSAEYLLKTRVALSSGPYSLYRLKRMGHPYAKRSPHPPFDAGVINVQTGKFRRSWRMKRVSLRGSITMRVYNADPKAIYMGGTKVMIERPVDKIALEPVRTQRKTNLENAIRTSLK